MEITLEAPVTIFYNGTAWAFTQIVNVALWSKTEEELRGGLKEISTGAENAEAHHFFEWGFGAHHLWVHQRAGYKCRELLDNRVLIVKF
ncbi:hypothetical protein [Bacteroides reticulotermitis]|uniref:Uncharacterized protein n=2 Tax=Bacteroides reticulotermitis TaxID=1133319 RepID=W4V070_9BACE|nr:hypothetical protein [Bacteroides reticulotermitis]MBB4046180.1 hypothetical protein [Bacteroides reticulotermitis]GAE86134.1 hypothetical protein JCM10512_4624 [Bacteroides reticulotermitis JCM 10512]